MFDITYGAAALAGLLSFLSPCILPMVPFYLCYMAGISMQALRGEGDAAAVPAVPRRLVAVAVAFALGVTTVFVLLGLGATAAGAAIARWRAELAWVAAGILALFGLHMLGVLRIPLLWREARLAGPVAPAGLAGAYATGLAFGFGWTPCVGPSLAAILLVASGTGDLVRGGSLLLVYGLAMTLPFVLAAGFARPFLGWAARHRRHLGTVEKVTGAMLLLFAGLIATDSVAWLAEALLRLGTWDATLR